jgi:Flp pilus assembly protein TadD
MGDLPKAYQMWQAALLLDSNHAEVWRNLGEYYLVEGSDANAADCFRRALQEQPMDTQLCERLATVLLALHEFDEAENVLVKGVNREQSDFELLYLLGVTYSFANKPQEAKNALQQGRNLVIAQLVKKPEDAALIAERGLFEARLGNGSDARRRANDAALKDPQNHEVMIAVARIYSILSEKAVMLKAFTAADYPDYDVAYLRTALDFENYRKDPDLLALARRK